MIVPPYQFPATLRLCALVARSVVIEEAGDDVREGFLEVMRGAKLEADAANRELHTMRGALAQLYRAERNSSPLDKYELTGRRREALARCFNLGRKIVEADKAPPHAAEGATE